MRGAVGVAVLVFCFVLITGCGSDSGEDEAGLDSSPARVDASGDTRATELDADPCEPQCEERECGENGCGGSCGNCFSIEGAIDPSLCMEGGLCCQPHCGEVECGDDGCGASCGSCGLEATCQEGQCIPDCVPDCGGKQCGSDKCGGDCGICDEGDECDANGQCKAKCVPDCGGKECGDDGCEGSCGACTGGDKCQDGVCGECVPDCDGKECGFDGCTGTCGSCQENGKCKSGSCDCKYGYQWSPDETACWPECVEGAENNSESGQCECPAGSHWNLDESGCWPDCPEGAHNDAASGDCVCDEGLEWSPDGEQCWPTCSENSHWSPEEQECLCDDGAVVGLDGETCLLECPEGALEQEGQCLCESGLAYDPETQTCTAPPLFCDLGSVAYAVPDAFMEDRFSRAAIGSDSHPVIMDLATGMMWMGCDAGLDGETCSGGQLSLKKPAAADSFCEDSQWAGLEDWRLPSMADWQAVVDNGLSSQIGEGSFFHDYDDIGLGDTYWSSTEPQYMSCPQECYLALMRDDPSDLGFQWYIQYAYASFGRRVRCVRTPITGAEHCGEVISGGAPERVIYLERANIFWQGCAAGQSGKECNAGSADIMSRAEASDYCQQLDWGGFDDWVLPDVNQFLTLSDYDAVDEPLVHPDLVPELDNDTCWTSTAGTMENEGWTFNFAAAQPVSTDLELTWSVRCTRACPGNFAGADCLACAPGWEGAACELAVGCDSEPCFPGVECSEVFGVGFECGACPEGYEGTGIDCVDVDGCADATCFEGVECFDVAAPGTGFECGPCPDGLYGDGVDCLPVLPCEEAADCGDHGSCLEVDDGVLSCVCDESWHWDGQVCVSLPLEFAHAVSFTTASWPWDVEAGDFDGDGNTDVVVTALLSDKMHVFLGDGSDGGFMSYTTETGDKPRGLALGDYNADDNLDIAVSRETDADVRLFYGSGDGTFAGGAYLSVASVPRTVTNADLNGDGIIDLVTGHDFSVGISVLTGKAGGGFEASYLVESWGHGHWELVAADLNSDGLQDLLLPDDSGKKAKIMIGNGGGLFGEPVSFDLIGKPFGVAVGDLNGDDENDAVLGIVETGDVALLLADGEGSFAEPSYLVSGEDTRDVVVADFNGDGHNDIAATNYGTDNVRVFYGAGDGSFPTHVDISVVGDVTIDGPAMLTAADFDGNGHPDIIVASQMNNRLVILRN